MKKRRSTSLSKAELEANLREHRAHVQQLAADCQESFENGYVAGLRWAENLLRQGKLSTASEIRPLLVALEGRRHGIEDGTEHIDFVEHISIIQEVKLAPSRTPYQMLDKLVPAAELKFGWWLRVPYGWYLKLKGALKTCLAPSRR